MGTNMIRVLRELIEAARKRGDTVSVKHLSTILGDLQRIDKDCISRLEFTNWIKSQFKAVENTMTSAAKANILYIPDVEYLDLLAGLGYEYALEQLTEVQIREYFAELVKLNPGITKGTLMKAIKEEFPSRYDGKVAAQIAGEFN
ncbi:recombination related exonuclease [Salmonella phage bobsandoy]|uniref:Recombination related exonuclease n=1 Tax=Salmonella phage bobsandoy TaxID=2713284 RepID=A0A6G8RJ02_9CAUD|nr:recombination related exonuclease [Salmonella phage bobsandoy]